MPKFILTIALTAITVALFATPLAELAPLVGSLAVALAITR